MAEPLDDLATAATLLRRVGFGPSPTDLDRVEQIGLARFVDELFEPDSNQIPDDGDPWEGLDVPLRLEEPAQAAVVVAAWIDRFLTASRPLDEWLAWYWHGHLVTSLAIVRSPLGLVTQIRLFREHGAGSFPELLRAVTVDPAMLRYLDGATSTGRNPNENYARELLELFALGVGNYTEADVMAAAAALTGWVPSRTGASSRFVPFRHDDSPQTLLGVDGVHDVDSVIDAVTGHPACAPFVAASMAAAVLGTDHDPAVVGEASAQFLAADLTVTPLLRAVVDAGMRDGFPPLVLGTLGWVTAAIRATGASLRTRELADVLRGGEQVPFFPPNVAGWPGADIWLSSSVTTHRRAAAQRIAGAADRTGPASVAADAGDIDSLARALGRPGGFSESTVAALDSAGVSGSTLLALALSSPDMVMA